MDPLGKRIFKEGGIFEHILNIKTNETQKEEENMDKKVKEPASEIFRTEKERIVGHTTENIRNEFAEDFGEMEDNTPKGVMPPPRPPIELDPELPDIPIPGPIPWPPGPIEPPPTKFDRLGDWEKFHQRMIEYLQIPIQKYGAANEMNDLLHYTGLRVMCWHLLKYSLRIWLGHGKRHDFEKIAHFAQMAWTRARSEQRNAPFFEENEIQKREFIVKG